MARSRALTLDVLRPGDDGREWDDFVDASDQGSIFCRLWWLETVCPGGFEILVLRKDGRIVAGMPLPYILKQSQRFVTMPPLTQVLGILLAPSTSGRREKNLSAELQSISMLVRAIEDAGFFQMRFHYGFTNWLPFLWAGYQQTSWYTYVLDDLSDLVEVFRGFAHSKRKNIQKAETLVRVESDMAPEEFYDHSRTTLAKRARSITYPYGVFQRLHDAARERGAGKTWYAVDEKGSVHAALFVVYDRKSAYYMVSSLDPDLSSSGALTLLVKHAITHVSQFTSRFDFMGSISPATERSFRRFGAQPYSYFAISRDRRPRHLKLRERTRRWLTRGRRVTG